MQKVNIKDKLSLISEYWKPIIVGELNNQQVRLVKIKGEFVMHKHKNEDELFLVIQGSMKMDYGDNMITVREGEFIVVPRGTEHRPVAEEEAHLLLFEPDTVLNTGNVRNEFTVDSPERQ
jgi:mannose-6-phosphate isomerase-like protein (cupin superfamily)